MTCTPVPYVELPAKSFHEEKDQKGRRHRVSSRALIQARISFTLKITIHCRLLTPPTIGPNLSHLPLSSSGCAPQTITTVVRCSLKNSVFSLSETPDSARLWFQREDEGLGSLSNTARNSGVESSFGSNQIHSYKLAPRSGILYHPTTSCIGRASQEGSLPVSYKLDSGVTPPGSFTLLGFNNATERLGFPAEASNVRLG